MSRCERSTCMSSGAECVEVAAFATAALQGEPQYPAGSRHWVDVTHIDHPHSFYVVPTTLRHARLAVARSVGHAVTTDVLVGNIVIFEKDLEYYRGEIFAIHENEDTHVKTCDLLAVDCGFFVRRVHENDLYKSFYGRRVPPMAMHCELADCVPPPEHSQFPPASTDAMRCYVGSERALMRVRGRNRSRFTVELRNTCPDDIATLLAITHYSTFGAAQNNANRMMPPQPQPQIYNFRRLELQQTLRVRVLCGTSLDHFYVAEESDYDRYQKSRVDVTGLCRRDNAQIQVSDMRAGLPVCVLDMSTNQYERAEVKEVRQAGEAARLRLVDAGGERDANRTLLRKVPPAVLPPHPIALLCAAVNDQKAEHQVELLLLPGRKFTITVERVAVTSAIPTLVRISDID